MYSSSSWNESGAKSENAAELLMEFEAEQRTAFLRGHDGFGGDCGWGGSDQKDILAGDFYVEPQNVMRSTCIAPMISTQWSEASKADPYVLDSCSSFYDGSMMGGKCDWNSTEDVMRDLDVHSISESDELIEEDVACSAHCMRLLVEGDCPLDTMAADVSNTACAYLKKKGTASIKEDGFQKFSIKADVFHEVAGCFLHAGVKVRIFKKSSHAGELDYGNPQQLVVKFLHQKGDAVVFSRICDEAVHYLQANLYKCRITTNMVNAEVSVCQAIHTNNGPCLPGLEDMESDAEMAQPLLDMLAFDEPELQAEALTALIPIVAANTVGVGKIIDSVREANLGQLVRSVDLTVSYPAACLALHIAGHYKTAGTECGEVIDDQRDANKQSKCAFTVFLQNALQDARDNGADQLVLTALSDAIRTMKEA